MLLVKLKTYILFRLLGCVVQRIQNERLQPVRPGFDSLHAHKKLNEVKFLTCSVVPAANNFAKGKASLVF